jgi:hypothetical protein
MEKPNSLKGLRDTIRGNRPLAAILSAALVLVSFGLVSDAGALTADVGTYDMEAEEITIGGWTLEGPVEHNGVLTTKWTAATATLTNFVQYYEENIITAPQAELQDVVLYCTWQEGTVESPESGEMVTLSWYGDEEPDPRIYEYGTDPGTIFDAVFEIEYQSTASTTFPEGVKIAPVGEVATAVKQTIDQLELEAFTLNAGPTLMTLLVNPADYPGYDLTDPAQAQRAALMDLSAALRGLKPLKGKTVMEDVTMVVPQDYGTEVVDVTIHLAKAEIEFAVLAMGDIPVDTDVEGYVPVKLSPMRSFGTTNGKWMVARGLQLTEPRLSAPGEFSGALGTFEINVDQMDVEWQNVTGVGFSQIGGQYYMVIEAEAVRGDLEIVIPGYSGEMVISAAQDVAKVELWVFLAEMDYVAMQTQTIQKDTFDLIFNGNSLTGTAMKVVLLDAGVTTLTGLEQYVR